MWKVDYTKRFLKELAQLPDNVQGRIENIIFQELKAENSFNQNFPHHYAKILEIQCQRSKNDEH
jgi:mRNA-degrading endonuclease RelE of RelBE toxin-antitoxin system